MSNYDCRYSILKISERLKTTIHPMMVILTLSNTQTNFCAHRVESDKVERVTNNEPDRLVGIYDKNFEEAALFEACEHVFHEHYPNREFNFHLTPQAFSQELMAAAYAFYDEYCTEGPCGLEISLGNEDPKLVDNVLRAVIEQYRGMR